MPILVRILVIIVAIIEWVILAFLTLLGFAFGLATLATVPIFVWVVPIVAVGYPIIFGALLFLFKRKLSKKKWYWFISAFNIFPIVWYLVIGVLDKIGLY